MLNLNRRIVALACLLWAGAAQAADTIVWTNWSPEIFAQAKRENRFVLLDLQAVWCHWCHVMDVNTYANSEVIGLIKSKYIAVRVDQDSRPDLANRYEDYGWPATIVFNADGGEIVKRQGYIPPGEMISMLKAIIIDPTPGPSVKASATIHFQPGLGLTPELRASVKHKIEAGYDTRMAGWGFDQKYMNCDNVEYCLAHAKDSNGLYQKMAQETLTQQLQLVDPVWGGVYQYSTDDDWKHPHYEKIMQMQAGDMRTYALAFAFFGHPRYEQAALSIDHYLASFLTSPDGALYTSQDADLIDGHHSTDYFELNDAKRRRKGIPRIDKHIYPRENGWAIEAMAALYCATGNQGELTRASQAAEWILANRSLPGGGFRHDEQDAAGPYLADTLAMSRAFLSLYEATADRQWLGRSEEAMQFIGKNFTAEPGYVTAAVDSQGAFKPVPQYSENVSVARSANLLSFYTGKTEYRKMAENALRWISAPEIAGHRFADVGGVLLADEELNSEPAHVTIAGSKHDAAAHSLWLAALKLPAGYRRIEWFDASEGPLPNPDVPYPTFTFAAAFLCSKGVCSAPITSPANLTQQIKSNFE